MKYERKVIDPEQIRRQEQICAEIFDVVTADGKRPLAMVDTYGCQQNEADSEKIRGYLAEMGYGFTQDEFQADVIVVNTCAVREHAEMRVLGNVGALNHSKKARPSQIVAVCGCMVQQEHMAEKIKKSYPVVDLVFGPHELWRFPELLQRVMRKGKRVFATEKNLGAVVEGIPQQREGKVKAWLSIMYGCNNFCTYCVVPYVRGRERSREPEAVLAEARELVGLHRCWICGHWGEGRYSAQAHLALGEMYLADERFRDYYDSRAGAGATEFLVAALRAQLDDGQPGAE